MDIDGLIGGFVRKRLSNGLKVTLCALAFSCVVGCDLTPSATAPSAYVTEYGLGPDKWATAWLLTKAQKGVGTLQVISPGSQRPAGIAFDLPGSSYRRIGNASAFEVARSALQLDDPVLQSMAQIVNDIEVNYWSSARQSQSQTIEDAYRDLQFRYGRELVTPACYVAFFDRVHRLLRAEMESGIKLAADQLTSMKCEELVELADSTKQMVSEIPAIDLLAAMAAGKRVYFVDVREADEYKESHIPDALNIPLRAAAESVRQFGDADYVVSYCVKDFRGFEMAKALKDLGVKNSVIMRPYGIKGWVAMGLPTSGSRAMTEEAAQVALKACLADRALCLHKPKS